MTRAGRVAQVVERLHSKYDALNSNPNAAKKQKKKMTHGSCTVCNGLQRPYHHTDKNPQFWQDVFTKDSGGFLLLSTRRTAKALGLESKVLGLCD
jgi:hypothetical protein